MAVLRKDMNLGIAVRVGEVFASGLMEMKEKALFR